MEKNVIFVIGCSGLFILAVTIPLSQSLSWRRPLTKRDWGRAGHLQVPFRELDFLERDGGLIELFLQGFIVFQ